MIWRDSWKAISANIHGLLEAVRFIAVTAWSPSVEGLFSSERDILLPHAKELGQQLRRFYEDSKSNLPKGAAECLESFFKQWQKLDDVYPQPHQNHWRHEINGRATCLASLVARFENTISDFEALAEKRVERAFIHLKRRIAVDETFRALWGAAFENEREEESERLGGVHLLSHGIWAFKVIAGERTDLVLRLPLDLVEVQRSADAMVLTEWKKCKEPGQWESRAQEAKKQCELYSGGSLAGLELQHHRYLVMLSERAIPAVPDTLSIEGSVVYRIINVAVDPEKPSKAARRKR